jgi:hypothetical protein
VPPSGHQREDLALAFAQALDRVRAARPAEHARDDRQIEHGAAGPDAADRLVEHGQVGHAVLEQVADGLGVLQQPHQAVAQQGLILADDDPHGSDHPTLSLRSWGCLKTWITSCWPEKHCRSPSSWSSH